ncbi:BPI fold-containing family C protein-like isoform X2 [Ascaphus truei]|uniref:BPI fold-containing family C protein-like isoform X2 n=1 Tax=Ascaphus truei TaxID=8439 RepID=UPI003F590688
MASDAVGGLHATAEISAPDTMLELRYICYVLLLSRLTLCLTDNPGIRVQVTQNGVKYGVDLAMSNLLSNISSLTLTDIKESTTIWEDTVDYEITQIRIVRFQYSDCSATVVPGTGIQIKIQGGNATINTDWTLNSWLINDSGTSVLTLTGISASVLLAISRNEMGNPSLSQLSCQAAVTGVDISLLGGVSYVNDALKDPMEKLVRSKINSQLCAALGMQTQRWDDSLSQIKLNFTLNPFVGLDIALVSKPVFAERSAAIELKGMFYSLVNQTEAAAPPATMALTGHTDSMFSTAISESSFNSASRAYYAGGAFNFLLSEILGSLAINTSHLAALLPEISQRFPEPAPVQVLISASRAPVFYLTPNNLTVEISGQIDIYVSHPDGKNESLLTAQALASISTNLFISDSSCVYGLNLTGSIALNRIQLQLENSPSAARTPEDISREKEIQQISQMTLIPLVNERLKDGICITSIFVKNPSIHINQGFVLLAADV